MTAEQSRESDISRRSFLGSMAAVGTGSTLSSLGSANRYQQVNTAPDTNKDWNSVALFFNLSGSNKPDGYSTTTVQDAKEWLDEGDDPASPTISEYMRNYWETLTYGELSFGIDAPRDQNGDPNIPTLSTASVDPKDWHELINWVLDWYAHSVWQAAGGLKKDGKRWIPSVVLVQNYDVDARANYGGFTRRIGGNEYLVGDRTHIQYNLTKVGSGSQRKFWSTLAHEYAHNFLAFGDLYGPQGAAGYYDLLGDDCGAGGNMSEVSSVHKERVGWLEYDKVIEGPWHTKHSFEEISLAPYTTHGEAIKVVPDPENNPHEYFVLEYRVSTGAESWRPDGGLEDDGLLITHINDRLGIGNNYLLRNAPYFDPEMADLSDDGETKRAGIDSTDGAFYPTENTDRFAPDTTPSSDFYGGRKSELYVFDIDHEIEHRFSFSRGLETVPVVTFNLHIHKPHGERAWSPSADDRAIAGQFRTETEYEPAEIFARKDDSAVLLTHNEAKWFVESKWEGRIDGWNLRAQDRQFTGDFDGDGKDEIYMRSDNWAGILTHQAGEFLSQGITKGRIPADHLPESGWDLRAQDREHVGNFAGGAKDLIYVRSDDWAGIIEHEGTTLDNKAIHHDRVGEWDLRAQDTEYVGRFSQSEYDEIMVRSNEWIGLLTYDESARSLRCENLQHDWVDNWNLGKTDQHVVGDFDGDGRDEIFVVGEKGWSGVFEWRNGRFRCIWINQGDIEYEGDDGEAVTPRQSDEYYAGQFLPNPVWHHDSPTSPKPDRDGVLLVQDDGRPLNVLTWESDEMKVRFDNFGGNMEWQSDNEFVLGDFHHARPDLAVDDKDYVGNNGTDIFVYNDWGSGMFGINYVEYNPLEKPDSIKEQRGITWKQQDYIMSLEDM